MSWKFNKKGESRSEIAKKNNFGSWMNGQKRDKSFSEKMKIVAKQNNFGLWMNGKKLTEETKNKIRVANEGKQHPPMLEETKKKIRNANKGKRYSIETEFKKGENAGDKSKNWKGDDAGYFALHDWVRTHKPKVRGCEKCNKEEKLEIANIKNHHYTRMLDDYQWLCRSCHRQLDYNPQRGIIQNE
jgi:NUMOD3 motif